MQAESGSDGGESVAEQRSTLKLGGLIALPPALGVWFAIYFCMPPIRGMESPLDRLSFAIRCCCVAVLLCFALGVEAIAHERLFTKAINPLAGEESTRMKVNLRYLQHTLEQLALFGPGLLALSYYCSTGTSMRAVVATTSVWIISRAVFWIGYHRAPKFRSPGLMGVAQSLLVLLYVCGRFGYDLAGIPGTAAILGTFVCVEIYLFRISGKLPGPARSTRGAG